MPQDFDAPEGRSFGGRTRTDDRFMSSTGDDGGPFIRISRSGVNTDISDRTTARATQRAERRAIPPEEYYSEQADEFEESPAEPVQARRTRSARPMPKRLSEELEEMEEAERERELEREQELARQAVERARLAEEEEEVAPRKRAARKSTKAKADTSKASAKEAEQLPLNLKPAKKKPDNVVKQRQVLGTFFVMIAILVTLAIVSYTADDAPIAETRLADVPSIFTGSNPEINARADMAHNWLRLLGAMLADFLINKTIGYAAIIYPIFFGWWSLALFRFTHKQRQRLTLATTFFLITAVLFSATIGTTQLITAFPHLAREWSGAVGQFLGLIFTRLIGATGALIVYSTLFLVTLVFSIDLDIEKTFLRLKGYWDNLIVFTRRKLIEFWDGLEARRQERAQQKELRALEAEQEEDEESETETDTQQPEIELEAPKVPETPAKTKVTKQPEVIEAKAETEPSTTSTEPKVMKRVGPVAKPMVKAKAVEAEDETASPEPRAEGVKIVRALEESAPLAVAAMVGASQPALASAAANVAPVAAQVANTNGLLKTRPAPKSDAGIPRMNRPQQDKLGERPSNLSRLTNGAIDAPIPAKPVFASTTAQDVNNFIDTKLDAADDLIDDATPIDSVEASPLPSSAISDTASNSVEEITRQIPRMHPTEIIPQQPEMIQPLKPRSEVRINLGDERVVGNESLPHSVMTEGGFHEPTLAADALKAEREQLDLYPDEATKKRVLLPENPYNENLSKYQKPSVELLTPADPKDQVDAADEELAMKGRLLRDKLATFGVEIENITVTPGPVVTLYEFTPAEGVKVSRVENLTDDIALAMKARGIRIIAPIPGRGTIGVEIPNDVPKMVRIRSLFESASFRETKMNLPLALGKTISGDVYVDDLNKMPHLLIAGATGAGKSVGVNGIIASLLYAKSPRDVKFVIVDPKKIELSLYKKLRKHFLIVSPEAGEDIVTTPAFAVLALKAVELEMEKRYDRLAKAAVRSLSDYNTKVAQGKLVSTQDEQHYHLPYIVVIIDELADLMITAGRDIEEPICRIAQMARAVGIHLILATQRPSVDVITGVIKANFPARVAFQVATRVDSRTILDSMGAEQLLGNGDMLYQPSGTPKPIRLQSPYISTEEVEAMIDAVGDQEGDKLSYSRPWTLPSLKQKDGIKIPGSGDDGDMRDELFEEAARIIVRHQQGSVSLLQRRLKVGYSRAARIVDELEAAGIVGAFDGSKARQVLCENEEELELVFEGLR